LRGHCPAATPQYRTSPGLVAVGALMTAIPIRLNHAALQRRFTRDLTIGSAKG
jgi:ABC-type maltose transport system permease subunit